MDPGARGNEDRENAVMIEDKSGISQLSRRDHLNGFINIDSNQASHARFLHGDTYKLMCHLHGDLVMGYKHELNALRHF